MILNYMTGIASVARREPTNSALGTLTTVGYLNEAVASYNTANNTKELLIPFAAQSHFCLSFYGMWYTTNASFSSGSDVLAVYDSTTGRKVFGLDSNNYESLDMFTYLESSSYKIYHNQGLADNTWLRFDFDVKIDATVGFFKAYVDGTLVYEFNGDTTNAGGIATADSVLIGGVRYKDDKTYIAGLFVTDGEDSRDITMVQHHLEGDGRFVEMGGSYQDLVAIGGHNNDTVVTASAANQTQTAQIDALPSEFSGYEVIAVGVDARVRSDSSGAVQTALVIDDGTTVLEGASVQGTGQFLPQKHIFHTAPDGTAWDAAKVAATDIGIRSK